MLTWELSNTLDGQFCLAALEQALTYGTPESSTRIKGFNSPPSLHQASTCSSPTPTNCCANSTADARTAVTNAAFKPTCAQTCWCWMTSASSPPTTCPEDLYDLINERYEKAVFCSPAIGPAEWPELFGIPCWLRRVWIGWPIERKFLSSPAAVTARRDANAWNRR